MRDPDTGNSRGFGFISYDSFEASDAAIEAMNGQYLCNRQITVSYAYKKDTKGERHGTPAAYYVTRPARLFGASSSRAPAATSDDVQQLVQQMENMQRHYEEQLQQQQQMEERMQQQMQQQILQMQQQMQEQLQVAFAGMMSHPPPRSPTNPPAQIDCGDDDDDDADDDDV